jgi:hypothetical protein
MVHDRVPGLKRRSIGSLALKRAEGIERFLAGRAVSSLIGQFSLATKIHSILG